MLYLNAGGFAFTCQVARIASGTVAFTVPPAATDTGAADGLTSDSAGGVPPPPSCACATPSPHTAASTMVPNHDPTRRFVICIPWEFIRRGAPPSRRARAPEAG